MSLRNILFGVLIFAFLLLFELAPFLSLGKFAPLVALKNVLLLAICYVQIQRNWTRGLLLPWYVKVYSVLLLSLIVLETVFGYASNISSPVIGLMVLLIFIAYSDKRFIRYFYVSMIIVTIISSIPLLYFYVKLGYYARTEIAFDKSMMTFLFAFCQVFLILEAFRLKGRNKLLVISLFGYLFWCNAFILQSKTSIFIALVVLGLLMVFRSGEVMLFLRRYYKIFVLGLIAIPFLPVHVEVPDDLKYAANKLTGSQVFVVKKKVKDETYTIRERLRNTTYQVVLDNPFFGAGFGNQASALKASKTGITEGESQMLDLLLDGGITNLIAFLILTIPIIVYALCLIWQGYNSYTDSFVLFQTLSFLILCIANEILNSVGWIFLGTIIYLTWHKNTIPFFYGRKNDAVFARKDKLVTE